MKLGKLLLGLNVALLSTGCYLFKALRKEIVTTEVSTLEELMEGGKKIKLMNDIDGENRTISPISGQIDGNGFTLRNFCISTTYKNERSSLFAGGSVSNITLENIIIQSRANFSAAIVSASGGSVENVTVKNCTIDISCATNSKEDLHVGGIFGGYSYEDGYSRYSADNCVVSGLTINATIEGDGSEMSDMYVGGIAGYSKKESSITNCVVSDCTFNLTSPGPYSDLYAGGIVGKSSDSIYKCKSNGNTFVMNARTYAKGAFSLYSTPKVYSGGIVGIQSEGGLEYCESESNKFENKTAGSAYSGGLAGEFNNATIHQTASKDNEITAKNYAKGNKNSVERYLGGIVGHCVNSTVKSSFAYNSTDFIDEDYASLANSTDDSLCGLIGYGESSKAEQCATYNKGFTCRSSDELMRGKDISVKECYVSSEKYGNSNSCELVDDLFWGSPNDIKEKLDLSKNHWSFEDDKLPSIIME